MKLLREPLVHFLTLGGLLFAVFAVADHLKQRPVPVNRIYVTMQTADKLAADFRKQSGHAPDAAERQRLIDDYVRGEVLVREARAQGIDRDDPVVRAELRRRMEESAASSVAAGEPSEADLEKFLAEHPREFAGADGQVPPLAQIRARVVPRWQEAQKQAAVDAAYQDMRGRYEVVVEQPAAAKKTP